MVCGTRWAGGSSERTESWSQVSPAGGFLLKSGYHLLYYEMRYRYDWWLHSTQQQKNNIKRSILNFCGSHKLSGSTSEVLAHCGADILTEYEAELFPSWDLSQLKCFCMLLFRHGCNLSGVLRLLCTRHAASTETSYPPECSRFTWNQPFWAHLNCVLVTALTSKSAVRTTQLFLQTSQQDKHNPN